MPPTPSQADTIVSPLVHALETHLHAFIAQTGIDNIANLHGFVVADVERVMLRVVMQACEGNQLRAADVLGLNRNTLRKKLTALDLDHMKARR